MAFRPYGLHGGGQFSSESSNKDPMPRMETCMHTMERYMFDIRDNLLDLCIRQDALEHHLRVIIDWCLAQ